MTLSLGVFSGCGQTPGETTAPTEPAGVTVTVLNDLSAAAEFEAQRSFAFFWEQVNLKEDSKGYGLIADRYPSSGAASIASVGFGMAALPIGVEHGWVTKEEAQERAEKTLTSMLGLETVHGFYYHFYTQRTGNPTKGVEVSCIDTALLVAGALVAGEYFGGNVEALAKQIYENVEWNWYVNPKTNQFYMGYNADKDKFSGAWDYYAEQLVMYFLGAGSPTHPIGIETYNSFTRSKVNYGGYDVIHSWFGSIFTYQFSHAFVDFRGIVDAKGVNWFDNSINATLASWQFAQDMSKDYKTLGKYSWGMTACDGPDGYSGLYGSAPSGAGSTCHVVDGTVPPCGAIGSIVFTPDLVLETMDYYYDTMDGQLAGKYGFYDAYNLENGRWIGKDVIGIDKGVSLLMIENYRSGMIWDLFMNCDFMQTALEVLQFQPDETPAEPFLGMPE
ncbi:MAG: hypothetical protein IKC09_10590 [Oscillospiraceae bacterium]|nr:hypothetical protein [Oscillospiraceae bacterium]MBR2890709.1 hypothetical protein [Oscillospiraceae bacterium]